MGSTLGSGNCESTGESLAFYLGMHMAPRKILDFIEALKSYLISSYFTVLLQIKFSSYTSNFKEINYDCSVRVSRSFATRQWPEIATSPPIAPLPMA